MTVGGPLGACLGGCATGPAHGCQFSARRARLRIRYPQLSEGDLLALQLRALAVPPPLTDDW